METIRFILPILRAYRGHYLLGLLLAPLSTALALAPASLLGRVVTELEQAVGRRDASLRVVYVLSAWILALALGRGLCLFAVRMLMIGASRGFEYDLRNRLFDRLQALDLAFYRTARTGDLMARLTGDVEAARTLVGPVVMYSANALSTLAIALPLMLIVDWRLTLLVMVPLSLLTLAVKTIGPRVHEASKRSRETSGELASFAQENFGGVRVVKAYAREEAELEAFRGLSLTQLSRSMVVERLSNWMGPIVGLVGESAVVLLLLAGGLMILRGTFTLGRFVEFAGYQTLLIWPMISIGWVLNQANRGTASVARLREVLDAQSLVDGARLLANEAPVPAPSVGPAAPAVISRAPCEIELRDVTFAYPGARTASVLSGVSLRVPRGKRVAVVGRTGSGKSTLLSLIPRLWPVSPGTVFLDGEDVLRIPLAELRARIGFVPQESFLFSRTILDNLAFAGEGEALPSATGNAQARARACAQLARLDKDVDQFPRGYAELVGERGVTLSGGQKQRAALARALFKDPPVLILDDPLSAVDAHTEEEILENLEQASRGRTLLLASHRVSAMRVMDRIYVLDGGRVVEEGTHRALQNARGLYARLCQRQAITAELEGL